MRGIVAVTALEALRKQRDDPAAKQLFERHKADLGFGLLLKKYVADVRQATPEIIDQAVNDTVPRVTPMFWASASWSAWALRCWLLFGLAFWSTLKTAGMHKPWLLKWALWMLPAPWIACELGWFVAEYGRQPWTIYGVLPTHLCVSTLSVNSLYGSLAGFIGFLHRAAGRRDVSDGQVCTPWARAAWAPAATRAKPLPHATPAHA